MKKDKKLLTKDEIIDILSREKQFLTEKYNISEIGIFGSYVRGEQKKKSDLDILVSFNKSPDFFKFIEIEELLSKIMGLKIDLVTKNALKPFIGKFILNEVIYI